MSFFYAEPFFPISTHTSTAVLVQWEKKKWLAAQKQYT